MKHGPNTYRRHAADLSAESGHLWQISRSGQGGPRTITAGCRIAINGHSGHPAFHHEQGLEFLSYRFGESCVWDDFVGYDRSTNGVLHMSCFSSNNKVRILEA